MNLDTIEQVVALIAEHPIAEITLEQDGQRVHVVRGAAPAPPPAVPLAETEAEAGGPFTAPGAEAVLAAEEPVLLSAPMVGLFHHLSTPVSFGAAIRAGQAVGSIQSMKLMNDVLAEEGGRVVEVLIDDGAPVEYGQPLFRLAPA